MLRILYFRDSAKVVVHSADAFAPVAYLRFLKLHLENKASRLQMSSSFKTVCMLSILCCFVTVWSEPIYTHMGVL